MPESLFSIRTKFTNNNDNKSICACSGEELPQSFTDKCGGKSHKHPHHPSLTGQHTHSTSKLRQVILSCLRPTLPPGFLIPTPTVFFWASPGAQL